LVDREAADEHPRHLRIRDPAAHLSGYLPDRNRERGQGVVGDDLRRPGSADDKRGRETTPDVLAGLLPEVVVEGLLPARESRTVVVPVPLP